MFGSEMVRYWTVKTKEYGKKQERYFGVCRRQGGRCDRKQLEQQGGKRLGISGRNIFRTMPLVSNKSRIFAKELRINVNDFEMAKDKRLWQT